MLPGYSKESLSDDNSVPILGVGPYRDQNPKSGPYLVSILEI